MFSSPSKDQYYHKFVRGLDNGDFLFLKFYNFFYQKGNWGLFDYGIESIEEKIIKNKKI